MNVMISATHRVASWLRGRRLATLAGGALVALVIGWLLTSVVIRQQGHGSIGAPPRVAIETSNDVAAAPRLDHTEIPAWHLFGQVADEARPLAAESRPDPVTEAVPDGPLPATAAQLTLTGVVYAPGGHATYAIVAGVGQGDKTYAVGDTLPGDIEISRIDPTRVVIRRAGRYEELPLPRLGVERGSEAGHNDTRRSEPEPLVRTGSVWQATDPRRVSPARAAD